MMRIGIISMGWLAALMLWVTGCGERGDGPDDANYNKEEMLGSLGSHIQGVYDQWQQSLAQVETAFSSYRTTKSSADLAELQSALVQSYQDWNRCAVFELGPAADQNLRLSVNSFPADTAKVEENISAGAWELELAGNTLAQGYPALDYLFFSAASLDRFPDSLRFEYAADLIEKLMDLSTTVNAQWDDYQQEFTTNTAASVGSPIGTLVNEINYEFELLKNARIGIPLGKKTLGVTQPEKVEALFSDQSAATAVANLRGIWDAFNGGSGEGLDDYLRHLDARYEEQLLADKINEGFQAIEEELLKVSSLHDRIESDPSSLEPLYRLIEQQVILLKTDMPSHLGVQITYQDNDGD